MDSLKNISLGMLHGFYDSIKGVVLLFYIDSQISQTADAKTLKNKSERVPETGSVPDSSKKGEPSIIKQILKCCILNGGFAWLSIILFENYILPGFKFMLIFSYGGKTNELNIVWSWLSSFMSFIFQAMWVLPIFLLSKIVSSLWFQDIANAAYKFRKGRPQPIPSFSKQIADFMFSILVQALFLVQSMMVSLMPIKYLGSALSFIHLCLLYSLYSFEYKWFNMGWELHKRLNFIECNWPYFLGFGMPLTILTSLPNSYIVSGCVFSIAFPIFILSGNEVQPVIGSCDYPLRLFSPVVALSNVFFSRSVRTQKPVQYSVIIPTVRKQKPEKYSVIIPST